MSALKGEKMPNPHGSKLISIYQNRDEIEFFGDITLNGEEIKILCRKGPKVLTLKTSPEITRFLTENPDIGQVLRKWLGCNF